MEEIILRIKYEDNPPLFKKNNFIKTIENELDRNTRRRKK